ncbi:MAG: acetylxylan esterase [Pirellula sp.]|nr:acetylxylan esterase [Pirellula sp.]
MKTHRLIRLAFLAALAVSWTLSPTAPVCAADSVPLKDLDGHFPFQPPTSLEAWNSRRAEVLEQLAVSQGLHPKPTFAPVKPVVHGLKELDGYAIAKTYFESLPGFYVTGTLYLPRDGKPANTKRPGVLCPHGHWDNGRFYHASDAETKNLLATGAERFESAARNHMQARCVQLARMGCVVFQYDMIGYADSQQISFDRAHRFGIKISNPDVGAGKWLLYSPQAEGLMQSTMALQTINSLQAFEFLANREDVDAAKIAITGASGGGTQSFIAAALEPRIAAAMPAVMVSTAMQGGCTCENACQLRVGTGNVEIAATIAPRPLGLTAANDWTKNIEKDGFPELQKVYDLFNAKKQVELYPFIHFPHNYNHTARVKLYGFINRTFQLGFEEPILERDFVLQRGDQLSVWDSEHPKPEAGIEFEATLLTQWANDVTAKIQKDPSIAAKGWRVLLRPSMTIASTLQSTLDGETITVRNRSESEVAKGRITAGWSKPIRVTSLSAEPTELGDLQVGDPNGLDVIDSQQPVVKNPRPAAAYTFGYNPTLMQRRVGVAVAALNALKAKGSISNGIVLEGKGDDAVLAKLIQKAMPDLVKEVRVVEPTSPENIQSIRHPAFVPGMLLYGL